MTSLNSPWRSARITQNNLIYYVLKLDMICSDITFEKNVPQTKLRNHGQIALEINLKCTKTYLQATWCQTGRIF